jgi:hypothetical protein
MQKEQNNNGGNKWNVMPSRWPKITGAFSHQFEEKILAAQE